VRARQAGDAIAASVGREAFVQDASALERIQQPNVVHVLGSLQAHRTVYRAMAYVDGPTLESHVQSREGPAQVGEIARLLDALLDGLEALHAASLVHGHVRPDQILLAGGRIDQPVLLGMGSAAAELGGHDAGPWDAPEQSAASRHDRINSATDLYMLASTAWFAATGQVPPTLRERLARPDEWDPADGLAALIEGPGDVPGTKARLVRSLLTALELLPSARPQHVADLRGLLHPSAARRGFESSGDAPLWVGPIPDRESQWEVVEMSARSARATSPSSSIRGREAQTITQVKGKSTLSAVDEVDIPPTRAKPAEPTKPPTSRPVALDEPAAATAGATGAPASRWALVAVIAATLALALGAWLVLRPVVPAARAIPAAAEPPAAVPDVALSTAPAAAAAPAVVVAPAATESPATTRSGPSKVPAPPVAATPPPPSVDPVVPDVPVARASPGTTPPPRAASAVARTTAPAAGGPAKPVARAVAKSLCGNASGFALAYCLQEECAKPANRSHAQCAAAPR